MRHRVPDHAVRQYLKELDAASRGLPRAERRDLRAQIEEHIRSALDNDPSDARLSEVLERLGDPHEIAAEQYGRVARRGIGAQAVTAIILLLVGGFLAGIGWIVGVVLLWTSQAWTTREKLVGTLLVPGGLAVALYLPLVLAGGTACSGHYVFARAGVPAHAVNHCTGGTTSTAGTVALVALFAFLVVAPIGVAIFLGRRARPPLAAIG
jgi:hypothetical protein